MNDAAQMTEPISLPADYSGANLVFLVGSPRSGTTWLQRLLSCHPALRTGQESHIFSALIAPQLRAWQRMKERAPVSRGGIGPGCYHTEAEFMALVRDYALQLLAPLAGSLAEGELFLEKTPGHARTIPEIREILPQARFIHLIRDPRDVVVSLLNVASSWGAHWAPSDAERAAQLWVDHVTAARRASRSLPPELYTEIRYEDLLADARGELTRMLRFLGLDDGRMDVDAALRDNSAEEAGRGGGTPIMVGGEFGGAGKEVQEPAGFVRFAGAGGWRRALSLRQKVAVWRTVRRTMRDVGYSWPHPLAS